VAELYTNMARKSKREGKEKTIFKNIMPSSFTNYREIVIILPSQTKKQKRRRKWLT
jgi:hypothetical protein